MGDEKKLEETLMKSFTETVPQMNSEQKAYILGMMQGMSMKHENVPEPEKQKTA